MKKYDSYKDSGVEWIGEIPSEWSVGHFKRVTKRVEVGIAEAAVHAYVENGGIPIIRSTNIKNSEIKGEILRINEDFATRNSTKTLFENDLITVRTGYPGATAVITKELDGCQCFTMLISTLIDSVFPKFYNYLLNSSIGRTYFDLTAWGSAQKNISVPILQYTPVIIPSLGEQISIANYLDHKTAQIDDLITNKERLIQLLEEERTAIINQAVTKGLDPTVPMKDSGIDWLGEIPEHWEVLSFRFCIDILTDFTSNGSFASLASNVTYLEEGYSRLVRLTDLRVNLENEGLYVDENAHNFLKKSELFGGEMLIANVGAYAGLVMMMPHIEGKYTLGPNMFLLRLNQNTEFFYHQLNAPFCSEQLKMMAISSAQPKLNKDNMRQLMVVKPPIDEQIFLVSKIKEETSRIDNLLLKIKQEIEYLKEYKTALISEVVTGKVDVRDYNN